MQLVEERPTSDSASHAGTAGTRDVSAQELFQQKMIPETSPTEIPKIPPAVTSYTGVANELWVKPEIIKRVSADEWINAMNATDKDVQFWLSSLLQEYGIGVNKDSLSMVDSLIKTWIRKEFNKEGLKIKENDLEKIFRVVVRGTYDALCVG